MTYLIILIIYAAAMIALGLYVARRSQNSSDFFVAGRGLGAGLIATTLLAAAGCFVAVFIMAGNGSLSGFFEQVSLLGNHFLAAPAAARSGFEGKLVVAAASVLLLTGFFRRSALIAIFRTGGRDGQ